MFREVFFSPYWVSDKRYSELSKSRVWEKVIWLPSLMLLAWKFSMPEIYLRPPWLGLFTISFWFGRCLKKRLYIICQSPTATCKNLCKNSANFCQYIMNVYIAGNFIFLWRRCNIELFLMTDIFYVLSKKDIFKSVCTINRSIS